MNKLATFKSVNNCLLSERYTAFTGMRVAESDFIIKNDYVVGVFKTDKDVRINTVLFQAPLTEDSFPDIEDCSPVEVTPDQLDWVKSEVLQMMTESFNGGHISPNSILLARHSLDM